MLPPQPHIEKDLIISAQQGDMVAFEKLVCIYERPIFSYILRIVNRREDAEDVAQDAFVKFFIHIKDIKPEKGCKSWLYATATNTAYDCLRHKQHRPEDLIIDSDRETKHLDPTYTTIEADINSQDLERALLQLKPIYASILLLFFKEGFSYEEIAVMLNLPIGTVKTHLHRAKAALHEKL